MVINTRSKIFALILILGISSYFTTEVITSSSGNTSNLGQCSGCHGSNSSATTVTIDVVQGTTINVGDEVDIEVEVSHGSFNHFGIYTGVVTTENGSTAAGTITAGTGTKKSGSGVVHNGKQTGSGGSYTFKYKWKAPNTAGTYYVRAVGNAVNNNGNGDSGDDPNAATTVAITVEDQASVTITAPNGGSVCAGENTNITWDGTSLGQVNIEISNNSGVTYTPLESNVDGSTGSYTWMVPSVLAGTTQNRIRITSMSDPNVTDESNSDFIVSGSPSITTQPSSLQSCSGEDEYIYVVATGGELTYTWKKNGTVVPNSDNDTLYFNSAKKSDSGNYTVDISSGCGTDAFSNTAIVSISEQTTIDVQPKGKAVCEGEDLIIESTVSGEQLTIEWYRGTTLISGQSSATLTIPDFDESMAGDYLMKVNSAACPGEVVSQTAKISAAKKPEIMTQPTSIITCLDSEATFMVEAEGTGLSYQWQKNGANISNATSATYTISNATKSDEGEYSVIVFGSCQPNATSEVAELTIGELPVINQQPTDQNVKVGDDVIITITDNGMADTYIWFKDGSEIATTETGVYAINGAKLTDSGEYYVELSNDCESIESLKFTLTVEEAEDPVLSVSATGIDFGIVMNMTESQIGIDLSNSGVGNLEINELVIDGPHSMMFDTDFQGTVILQGDDVLTTTITYSPSVPGYHTALLTIRTTDGQEKTVDLIGGSRNGSEAASYELMSSSVVPFDQGGAAKATVKIINNGPDEFSIESVDFNDSDGLSHDAMLGTTLEAGSETEFDIIYTSNGVDAEKNAEFTISFDGIDLDFSDSVLFKLNTSVRSAQEYGAIVHPNPANEHFTISLGSLGGQTVRGSLIDMNGNIVMTTSITGDSAYWSSEGISSGSYLLLLELTNGENRYLKVILE